jgi:hypothetical protein
MIKRIILMVVAAVLLGVVVSQPAMAYNPAFPYVKAVRYPNDPECKALGGNATYHVARLRVNYAPIKRNIWDCWRQTATKRVLVARKIESTPVDYHNFDFALRVYKKERITKADHGSLWWARNIHLDKWIPVRPDVYIAGKRPTRVDASLIWWVKSHELIPTGTVHFDYWIK